MDRSQLYIANLDALNSTRANPLTLPTDSEGNVRIDERQGDVVARLHGPADRWVLLHSERDPVGEADQQLEALVLGRLPKIILVVGLGLGYVLDALERRPDCTTKIVALEPSPALARAFLERRDWREWFLHQRLALFVGPEYAALGDLGQSTDITDPPAALIHPVLARLRPDLVEQARKRWADSLFGARANADARAENAGRYLLNTLRNIPAVVLESDVSPLAGALPGTPAIVAGAGPSLDLAMADLATVRDRAVLIAVDTAVRPLLAKGIVPDVVLSIDPSEDNGRHLAGLPPLEATWLVAEASLDPHAVAPFEGRAFLFTFGHHPWPWLESVGFRRGSLRAWGSVATSAVDLALTLGCSPIVFSGLDLAFTDGRPYCRGTVYEYDWAEALAWGGTLPEEWAKSANRWPAVSEPDVNGADAVTAEHLLAFRNWIVDQTIAASGTRFVNASGAGVLHGGEVVLHSLRNTLEAKPRVDAAAFLRRAYDTGRATSVAAVDALVADLGNPAGRLGGVVREWLAFASGTVTTEEIENALRQSGERLARPISGVVAPAATLLDALPYPAEEVEKLCRLLANPCSLAASGVNGSTIAAVGRSVEILFRLLASKGQLALGVSPKAHARDVDASSVSVLRQIDWSPASSDLARALDRAMVAAVVKAVDADGNVPRFWAEADEPVGDAPRAADAGSATGRTLESSAKDSLARFELLRQNAVLVAWACGSLDPGEVVRGPEPRAWAAGALTRLLREIAPRSRQAEAVDTGNHARHSARYTLELSRGGRESDELTASGQIDPSRLMRALTGVLVAAPGITPDGSPACAESEDGEPLAIEMSIRAQQSTTRVALRLESTRESSDPRRRFLTRPLVWLTPRLLSSDSVPSSIFGLSTSDDHATMTPLGGARSYRLDEHGRATAQDEWPAPIDAERPWGDRGGAIAWYSGRDPYLMWRSRPGVAVQTVALDFRPTGAEVTEDGRIWWASTSGGLWVWSPGGVAERVAPTPPAFGLRCLPNGQMRLDPWTADARGYTMRVLCRHAWLWSPGSRVVEPIALGPEGAIWSTSARDGWIAEACPHADIIECTHSTGARASLACYFPVTVAWAGPSLVVAASTGGQLLLFENLLGVLDGMRREG